MEQTGRPQCQGKSAESKALSDVTKHEFHETCHSVTFYFMKNSFSDINRKCILPNKIRVVNHIW